MRVEGLPGFDNAFVDRIMNVEKQTVEASKKRRAEVVTKKDEYLALDGMMRGLDSTLNSLKSPSEFTKLKINSSNPEILEGTAAYGAIPGNYEFEVRGLAKSDKYLDAGFPDRNETTVGFGFMAIEKASGEDLDVVVEPGSTLQDVASQINDMDGGVRATIVNTGFEEDPFKLMVASTKSGEAAKIRIDEDTTFLDFKNIKAARGLDVMFEDVPVTGSENKLNDLLDGLNLNVKKSSPGTKVQINIGHDVTATKESVVGFLDNYNKVAEYINGQFTYDPSTQRSGTLGGSSNLRSVMRGLQTNVSTSTGGTKYSNLAEIGITTDPRTGKLNLDDQKLETAIASNYDDVAKIFTGNVPGEGLAGRMATTIKNFRSPSSGVISSRIKGLTQRIRQQDDEIAKQETRLEQKRETLTRQFANMQSKVEQLNSQSAYLQNRMP